MKEVALVLGNQLFARKHYKNFPKNIFMCESYDLCAHYKYHKHKIIQFLSSMRSYADELKGMDKKVHYQLFSKKNYIEQFRKFLKDNKVKEVYLYEIEDKFFEKQILELLQSLSIEFTIKDSPMFLCNREAFSEYLDDNKKAHLNTFYIKERKRLKILVNKNNEAIGGKWNFDEKNRKKIPKNFTIENFEVKKIENKYVKEVSELVEKHFSDHPGDSKNYWLPIDRKSALKWYNDFLDSRFSLFGDYQDALDERDPFLYHSLISTFLNIGFISPKEAIDLAIKRQTKDNLNSIEGFVRQIMGWREFVRGIYQNFSYLEENKNFFKHKNKLSQAWYKANTGIPPLDYSIKKANEWGYCHHIERLMVIGNIMLLSEISPKEVHRWFMEMFVDSSDWVMGPNVYGMSQFSDGGLFATKPYICGSNYLLKMSHYKKDPEWTDALDGLYWRFVDRKRKFLVTNHRMNMMVKMLDKMDSDKKKRLFKAAEVLEKRLIL